MTSQSFYPEVACSGCGEPIVLHIPTLAPIRGNLGHLPMDFYPIAVACPRCKRVAKYDRCHQLRQMGTGLIDAEAEEVKLSCAREGCEGSLVVYSFAPKPVSQAEIDSWTFSRKVQCSSGHRQNL
jgi:hypothetical protein